MLFIDPLYAGFVLFHSGNAPDPALTHRVRAQYDVTRYVAVSSDEVSHSVSSVVATGIAWADRTTTGQAAVRLQPASDPGLEEFYPNSTIFSVDVMMGDRPERLVIDTGASNSVLAQHVAQEMELSSSPVSGHPMNSFVVGDQCPALSLTLYEFPVIGVGSASVSGISGIGLPFNTNPTGTAGVLGMDFLSEFDVVLDPTANQLQLLPATSPTSDAIPLIGKMGLMTGNVVVNGQTAQFMLDTGASLTIVSNRLAQQLNLDLDSAQPIDLVGFCGTETGHYLVLERLSMGTHDAHNLDIIILDHPVLEVLEVDGILGQNFLSRYRQHWQFGSPNEFGFPQEGRLELVPLDDRSQPE
ncbi:MAG: retroviral-like aspartic protease family protein [Elainellaceae cyanobacterium]